MPHHEPIDPEQVAQEEKHLDELRKVTGNPYWQLKTELVFRDTHPVGYYTRPHRFELDVGDEFPLCIYIAWYQIPKKYKVLAPPSFPAYSAVFGEDPVSAFIVFSKRVERRQEVERQVRKLTRFTLRCEEGMKKVLDQEDDAS